MLAACLAMACTESGAPPSETGHNAEDTGDGDTGDGDGDTGDGDGDGDTGDGDGDTGDGDTSSEPRMCDEGLTLCCPGGADDCDDQWADWDAGEMNPMWQEWGCVDTEVSRFHCGGCAHECPTDDLEDFWPGFCDAGACVPVYQGCELVVDDTVTCDQVCTNLGFACSATGCGPSTLVFLGDECGDGMIETTLDLGCDQPLPAEHYFSAISCCCEVD